MAPRPIQTGTDAPPTPPGNGINLQKTLIVIGAVIVVLADFWHHQFDLAAAFNMQGGPSGGEGPFLIVTILGVVLLLIFDKAWAYLVAGITTSLLPFFILVFVEFVFGAGLLLADIKQGVDFGTIWLLVLALLLALPAGIMGFVRRRKARPMRSTWRSKQAITAMVISAFCVAMALAGAFTASSAAAGTAASGYDFPVGQSVGLTTQDATYKPNTLTIAHGNITEIVVTNKDNELHTFTYVNGGKEYSHDLLGGKTTSFLVQFDHAGTVKFRCKPHSTGYDDPTGMTGTITVT